MSEKVVLALVFGISGFATLAFWMWLGYKLMMKDGDE